MSNYLNIAGNAATLNDMARVFNPFQETAGSGIVLAANDANFDATYLSEPLTEYLVDYPDEEGLDRLLEGAAPSVPVGRAFQYHTADDKSAFQLDSDDADIREIGGDFAQVRRTGTRVDGRTDNKGLVTILDNDQGGEDPAVQQRTVANLRNRLLRTELYRVEALLEANDTAEAANWKSAGSDPDGDLAALIDTSGDLRGIDANTMLFGGGAWVKRYMSMGLDANAARYTARHLTPEQLADVLGIDRVLRSKFRYQSSSTAKTKVVADKVFAYYVRPGASKDDPTNIKRFVTAVPGGGMFRVYVQPLLKRTAVAVEHYSRVVCTSTLGIRKLAVTYT